MSAFERTIISMRKPFATIPHFATQFPSPEELREVLLTCTQQTRGALARLWLSEGVPCAFRSCPGVYEDMRGWLSSRLGVVHAKEITLVGSARTGYSLADFGKVFGEHSDLDFCIVSRELFSLFCAAFDKFSEDYQSNVVQPRHEREKRFWDENMRFGRRNLPQGFFDADKLPTFDRYEIAQRVRQSMWELQSKLEMTPVAPRVRRASVRVYRDWKSLVERLTINLKTIGANIA